MIPTATNGFGSWETTTEDSGGASEAWEDVLAEYGDTDTVFTTTPPDRPDEDPEDDPGNATDPDSGSVNVTQPEAEDPVDTYDSGDSASDSDGGGTSPPVNVEGSDGEDDPQDVVVEFPAVNPDGGGGSDGRLAAMLAAMQTNDQGPDTALVVVGLLAVGVGYLAVTRGGS